MCEAYVYLIEGYERLILGAVNKILPVDDVIETESIFSQRKINNARIKDMALVEHRIVLDQ